MNRPVSYVGDAPEKGEVELGKLAAMQFASVNLPRVDLPINFPSVRFPLDRALPIMPRSILSAASLVTLRMGISIDPLNTGRIRMKSLSSVNVVSNSNELIENQSMKRIQTMSELEPIQK
jgi:hypothetical protein